MPNTPCPHCGRYANRGVSIDAVIMKNNDVLLIKRGVEPHIGLWRIPGGYVGWNESTEDVLRREVKEETNLDVKENQLVGVYSDPKRHPKQVVNIVYLVTVDNGKVKHGDDAVEAKWFPLDELPDKMAIDTNKASASLTNQINLLKLYE